MRDLPSETPLRKQAHFSWLVIYSPSVASQWRSPETVFVIIKPLGPIIAYRDFECFENAVFEPLSPLPKTFGFGFRKEMISPYGLDDCHDEKKDK